MAPGANPKTSIRTADEAEADYIDLRIFNLISRVEKRIDAAPGAQRWTEIARDLRSARARTRGLMHSKDREETRDYD